VTAGREASCFIFGYAVATRGVRGLDGQGPGRLGKRNFSTGPKMSPGRGRGPYGVQLSAGGEEFEVNATDCGEDRDEYERVTELCFGLRAVDYSDATAVRR